MSLAQTLLGRFEVNISALTLVPSDGGKFEVVIDGDLIYSKLETHRHTSAEEIIEIMKEKQFIKG